MPDSADRRSEEGILQPGTLWEQAKTAHTRAVAAGALESIPAIPNIVEGGGINFVVWRLERPEIQIPEEYARIEKPAYSDAGLNPFLPYDLSMFVANITSTHVCLLNKYNILSNHLLLVTRQFEHQTKWLTLEDFKALWRCMAEYEGLAFYNGGKVAGASQRHKHLQYVPFPLGPENNDLPIGPAIETAHWRNGIGTVTSFPFVHALGRLDARNPDAPEQVAELALALYWKLLNATGIPRGAGDSQTRPYNLLATRRWMMIVPRSRESYAGMSVNALGFAGSLLVRDHAQLQTLRETGPLTLLQHVGIPRDAASRAIP